MHGRVVCRGRHCGVLDLTQPVARICTGLASGRCSSCWSLACVVRFRLASDRRFRVTPLDVLVIFTAVIIPNLPGSIVDARRSGRKHRQARCADVRRGDAVCAPVRSLVASSERGRIGLLALCASAGSHDMPLSHDRQDAPIRSSANVAPPEAARSRRRHGGAPTTSIAVLNEEAVGCCARAVRRSSGGSGRLRRRRGAQGSLSGEGREATLRSATTRRPASSFATHCRSNRNDAHGALSSRTRRREAERIRARPSAHYLAAIDVRSET